MYDDPEYLTDAKLEQFERFFAPLAPALEAFAQRHNLRIEKYHRAQPNWSLHFRMDDLGSRGHLQILKVGDNQVLVAGHRERIDLEGSRRLIVGGGVDKVTLTTADPQVREHLRSMLLKIINYPESEMVSDGFDWLRAQRSREERDMVFRLFVAEPLVSLDD
jgi:hypothetical protein